MSSINPQVLIPYLPDNSPFTPNQRAYLNGLLAGIFCSKSGMTTLADSAAPARPLTILFGSQTGNAEMVAKQAAKKANAQGFQATVYDMEAYPKENLATETILLIITSTYGEGEPPDNAMELHAYLMSNVAPKLDKVHFAVLGLGDSNYPDFNQCAKEFDARLAELGGRRLQAGVYCDVEFDDDFAKWISGTLAVAGEGGGSTDSASQSKVTAPVAEAPTGYSRNNPFPAKLLTSYNLNKVGSAKETRHVEICLEGSGLEYEAGDALGVFPVNCNSLVEEFLALTGFDGEEVVPGINGREVALRLALAEHYDITNLSKLFLANIAPFANHEVLNKLLADGNGNLDSYIAGRQVIDSLVDFPGEWSSAAEFIGMFKKMAPRLYSISSSPKAHPGHVHLTVGAVRYETHGRARKGVCSTFLAGLLTEKPVRVFVQPNKHFKPPIDPTRPMIMVGPGTGIAPFRAFLEERHATNASGKNWLFFGDQKSAFDFLYEDQLNEFKALEKLHRLDLAFSRDSAEKLYVQHRMIEQADELFSWLEEGGHFYVCGDASRMAKDVDAALHQVIKLAGHKTDDEAAAYVDELRKQKRYVRDVY